MDEPNRCIIIIVKISCMWFLVALSSISLNELKVEVLDFSRGHESPVEHDLTVEISDFIVGY